MSFIINRKYKIFKDNILGKGAFGKVYKGIYVGPSNQLMTQGMDIAIKEMSQTNINNLPKMNGTPNEIMIIKKLVGKKHLNVVTFYDVVEFEDYTYIVMELCENGSLSSLLYDLKYKNNTTLNSSFVKFYFSQIISGMLFLHSLNIMHRDLKPENILLTNKKSTLKIVDFGLAKYLENDNLTTTMCGSPQYMAPELVRYQNYSSSSELWTLGIILYELVYNKNPFYNCRSHKELFDQFINQETIVIPEKNKNGNIVPESCINLLKKLLEKNTIRRLTWDQLFNEPFVLESHDCYKQIILERSQNINTSPSINNNNKQQQPIITPIKVAEPTFSKSQVNQVIDKFIIIDDYEFDKQKNNSNSGLFQMEE
ncbi:serine/threonine protein kinase [Hokovirus HKV1]|uniref:Serine/threonine protein kinase n=1 Tax=Hokovirus HKV1 TaxID=1977638 RepID=A0A1V0SH95_9VIRU|nr:serine/threonine protein kinase [Hokovirus HKV1]